MSNLADVKVGDLLIKHSRVSRSVVKVEKLTPTQIVVTGGDRFRKRMVMKLVVEVFTIVIYHPKGGRG